MLNDCVHERAKLDLMLTSKLSREAMQVFHSLWKPCGLLERHLELNSREISWLREETPGGEMKETASQSRRIELSQLSNHNSCCRLWVCCVWVLLWFRLNLVRLSYLCWS